MPYLVMCKSDDFDCTPECLGVASTQEKAEAFIEKEKASDERFRKLQIAVDELRCVFMLKMESFEFWVSSVLMFRKPIPKWKSGVRQQDITKAMREERDAVIGHNKAIEETYRELHTQLSEYSDEYLFTMLDALGYSPEECDSAMTSYMSHYYTLTYSVEYVEDVD